MTLDLMRVVIELGGSGVLLLWVLWQVENGDWEGVSNGDDA